jgi:hypothetical protein
MAAPTPQAQITRNFLVLFFKKEPLAYFLQNRKYRCAIGKISAGSQISNSPSARTS